MARSIGKFVLFWVLLTGLLGPMTQSSMGGISVEVFPQMADLTGTNYNLAIFAISYIDSDGGGTLLAGPLLSITNAGESVPLVSLGAPSPFTNSGSVYYPSQLFSFSACVASDVFYETYTLTWINYSADVTVDFSPFFLIQPQGGSVFVGSNVAFTAQAVHATGYQWQRGGTNLVENGHYIGVTNATLTISNAQVEDAGDYTVIADHPDLPTTSFDAILGVFKPIQLGVTQSPADGSYQIQVGNQDASPVDDNEVSHFTFYTTTDLSLGISNWEVESAAGVLTNGIYQLSCPDDGSPARFWQVGQQP